MWKSVLGKETTGPENTILNECNSKWDETDKKKTYKTLEISDSWSENKAKDVVEEISQLLARESRTKDSKLRGDYKPCAELALAVIGHTPPEFLTHHLPGAARSARSGLPKLGHATPRGVAQQISGVAGSIQILRKALRIPRVYCCTF